MKDWVNTFCAVSFAFGSFAAAWSVGEGAHPSFLDVWAGLASLVNGVAACIFFFAAYCDWTGRE